MADKKSKQSSRTAGLARYWNESARPLVSLVFIAPMIVAYEVGLVALGPQAMRNGADVWLRQLLEAVGFSQYFLLPILTCAILLGWHHVNHERWSFRGTVFYGMLLESMALGFVLLLIARVHGSLFAALAVEPVPLAVRDVGPFGKVIAFFGAGIYEELLFRLMLFPALAMLLQRVGVARRTGWVIALVLSSLLFSAAHFQLDLVIGGFHLVTSFGDKFDWMRFLFRFSAGAFFAVLLLTRGFGIAAGTHAFYDILVSIDATA